MSPNTRAGLLATSIIVMAGSGIGLVVLLVSRGGSAPSSAKDLLLGTWQSEDSPGRMEFRADGGLTLSGPKGAAELRYRRVGSDALEWSRADGTGKPIRMRIEELSARRLVLVDPDGQAKRFVRVQ